VSITTMRGYCGSLRHMWLLLGMLMIAVSMSAQTSRIYVTNASGDTVSVIDPATNKVVQSIEGVESPHGVAFSPDGKRVYISVESENTLDVVDQKTGEIVKKVPLSGGPNNIAISKDGGRVFVCIAEKPGALDIVDTTSLTVEKTIPMKGPLHNVYVTPDGKFAVMGSVGAKLFIVVDTQTEQIAWELPFDNGVRNMAIEANPDGSTRRVFAMTSFLHGFEVVDFARHEVVAKIMLPDDPSSGKSRDRLVPCHGIGITPDGKTLWVNSRNADAAFVYSLPDLKLIGHALVGIKPDWITFTADSKFMYDCNTAENTVSVIDTETFKEVARIPVGQGPKRSNTLVLR
jgi:YVTN family beta-propeller protein